MGRVNGSRGEREKGWGNARDREWGSGGRERIAVQQVILLQLLQMRRSRKALSFHVSSSTCLVTKSRTILWCFRNCSSGSRSSFVRRGCGFSSNCGCIQDRSPTSPSSPSSSRSSLQARCSGVVRSDEKRRFDSEREISTARRRLGNDAPFASRICICCDCQISLALAYLEPPHGTVSPVWRRLVMIASLSFEMDGRIEKVAAELAAISIAPLISLLPNKQNKMISLLPKQKRSRASTERLA